MFCISCGKIIEKENKFCGRCGTNLESDTPNPEGGMAYVVKDIPNPPASEIKRKKAPPPKVWLLVAFALFVLVAVCATVIFATRGAGGRSVSLVSISEFGIIHFFQEESRILVVANNAEVFTIEGEQRWTRNSMDGNIATVITDIEAGVGGTLWLVTEEGATRIAENVVYSKVSSSGRGILYFADLDEETGTVALYLYDTGRGRSRRVADEAYNLPHMTPLSPDGRSFGYVVRICDETSSFVGYLVINGRKERLGEDAFPVAFADDGKYVYFMRFLDQESREEAGLWWEWTWPLYVRSGREETLVNNQMTFHTGLLFNRDLSQLIISTEGRIYISRDGQEGEHAGYGAVMVPLGPLWPWLNFDMGSGYLGSVQSTWVDCFANHVVLGMRGVQDRILMYIDEEFQILELPKVDGHIALWAQLVDCGNTLLLPEATLPRSFFPPYRHPFDLHRVVVGDAEAEVEKLVESIKSFIASTDGRFIYFRNEEDELWVMEDFGGPQFIAENVSSRTAMIPGSHKLFFIVDWEAGYGGYLYYSDRGGAAQRVQGADNVSFVYAYPTHILYRNVDRDVYRSNGDGNFELVSEGRLRPEREWSREEDEEE